MCVHDFPVFVFCSHTVLRGPIWLKNIKDLDLCVFSPTTKVRIEVVEVRPSALKVAALSLEDGL